MRRRELLKSGTALAAMTLIGGAAPSLTSRPDLDYPKKPGTLGERAAAKGIAFGCAVKTYSLKTDKPFADMVSREAKMLVAEYEMKREVTEPKPGVLDFAPGDMIRDFGKENGQQLRGHALCWYAANPPWLEQQMRDPAIKTPVKQRLLTDYVDAAARHYAGTVVQWDVVNEPVDPGEKRADGMRVKNIWSEALGEDYIDLAFHSARAADPAAKLYLNEFGIESDIGWNEAKRTAILKLLDRLKSRCVPIDGFGIQGHLQPYKMPFNERIYRDFLEKIAGYGLDISVTELDLSDRGGFSDVSRRDNDVAAVAKAFLDVTLDFRQTKAVLCWGLTDRYSWLTSRWASDPWPDGQFARVLPFSAEGAPKKLYRAIGAAFDAAPKRAAE